LFRSLRNSPALIIASGFRKNDSILRNELFGSAEEYQRFVMDYADEQTKQEEIDKLPFG
jgi:hypothetical protein